MINYYMPGVDASQLTDEALAIKLAHLTKIRKMEGESDQLKFLNNFSE